MNVMQLKSILDTVRVQLDLEPHDGETFCNIALDRVLGLCGIPRMVGDNGQPLMANDMIDFMRESPDYAKIDGNAACARASQGILVIACQQEASHGHVVPIYPAPMEMSGSYGKAVPMCSNVGRTIGVMRVSQAFKTEPLYYAFKI